MTDHERVLTTDELIALDKGALITLRMRYRDALSAIESKMIAARDEERSSRALAQAKHHYQCGLGNIGDELKRRRSNEEEVRELTIAARDLLFLIDQDLSTEEQRDAAWARLEAATKTMPAYREKENA